MPAPPVDPNVAKALAEANKIAADTRIELMKGYADYNYRLQEVAGLQQGNLNSQVDNNIKWLKAYTEADKSEAETDLLREERRQKEIETQMLQDKLRRTIDATNDFMRARNRALAAEHKAEADAKMVGDCSRWVGYLAQGQTLPADSVINAWRGFQYFVNMGGPSITLALVGIPVGSPERQGIYFSRNSFPNQQINDAPSEITDGFSLCMWARKNSLLPKINTPPYAIVAKAISVIGETTVQMAANMKAELSLLNEELQKLRDADWKQVDIDMHPPKEEAPQHST